MHTSPEAEANDGEVRIEIGVGELVELRNVEPSALAEALSTEERSRFQAFRSHDAALEFAAARALAKTMIVEAINCEIGAAAITVDEFGKPHAVAGGVFISIAHGSGLAVCATARVPVGVDVEGVDVAPAVRLLAETQLAVSERRRLALLADSERNALFARIWTLKEAYVKATGEGMRRPFQSFSIDPAGDGVRVAGRAERRWRAKNMRYRRETWIGVVASTGGLPLDLRVTRRDIKKLVSR